MATGQLTDVLRHLRRLTLAQEAGGLTDGQLLERFLARHEEAAFEALLRRHGPMVFGVCQRILHNADDAEDAFQATFLVLVRKAASVMPREAVGNWLYGVAYRTALKARELLGKRRAKERTMAKREAVEPPAWDELRPLLDQELSRLPDKYRLPVVLCDLEGKKRKDVAQHLGWPEGTLSCRLARARALLARRLAKHGLAVSGAALGATLSGGAAAGVPESLTMGTIRAAMHTAPGLISARVAALTEGVLEVMSLAKMKTSFFVVLAVGVMLTAGGVLAQRPADAGQSRPPAGRGNFGDTILVLDQQFWDAGAKHDTATLGRLFADDFVGLTPDGTRWTRASLLDHYQKVRTGDLQVTKPKEVVRLNAHTAVLTYEAKFKIYNRNGTVRDSPHQRMTSCWVQRDGGWFVKFSQAGDARGPYQVPLFTNSLNQTNTIFSNPNSLFSGYNTFAQPGPYFTGVNTLVHPQYLNLNEMNFTLYRQMPLYRPAAPAVARTVVTARHAARGSAEVRSFSWLETPGAPMPFRVIVAKATQTEATSFPDLQEGIHLSGGPLDRVTELTVDGTLKKLHSQFGRTNIEVAVPTNGAKALKVDGFLMAGPLQVQIDGKPANLKDLKAGMLLSMRMMKKSDTLAAVEIRAGKSVESLQPKEAAAARTSSAQELQNHFLYLFSGGSDGATVWQNPINGPTR
jgi:RNA polymerase sigma factor (sigma-70 family)